MENLLWYGLAFAAGLVVGWNFIPQPQWVADIFSKFKKG
jgi:hypothetical protein